MMEQFDFYTAEFEKIGLKFDFSEHESLVKKSGMNIGIELENVKYEDNSK